MNISLVSFLYYLGFLITVAINRFFTGRHFFQKKWRFSGAKCTGAIVVEISRETLKMYPATGNRSPGISMRTIPIK